MQGVKMTKKLFKRGMSPIITTILLIALVVSVGATVMSFGGAYYGQLKSKDSHCSMVLLNAFELEGKKQCQNYEFKSIFNFYSIDEPIVPPQCYKGIGTGKGNICVESDELLNFTWVPIKTFIR
jgi:flagellin-like protein